MAEKGFLPVVKPDAEMAEASAEEPLWREILPEDVSGSIRSPVSARRLRNWCLVLESRWIAYRLGPEGKILVPKAHLQHALTEIRLFEKENRGWPPIVPEVPLAENTLSTLSVLFLLAIFHNLTRLDLTAFGWPPVDWLGIGDADAGKILQGQWWRLVTALTLHLDSLHLLGNLLIGGFFIVRLCREAGSGLGWFLLLLSGITGNLFNAWLQLPQHKAVGASTAVFGAVGILASLSVLRNRRSLLKKWPVPLAAGAALLGLLGTGGENTDLGAHLFGFGAGLLLGAGAGLWFGRHGRPGRAVDSALAAAAALLPVLAWLRAFLAAGRL